MPNKDAFNAYSPKGSHLTSMPQYCLLDILPPEIFYIIFSYFWAHEILPVFLNVSNHIDSILFGYSTWEISFKSIRKDYFELVCNYIQPKNVISLVLSDDIDTPGQSQLFLNYFRIEQFIKLRSLKLIKIEHQSLQTIFSEIEKLEQLNSFTFITDTMPYKYWTKTSNYSNESQSKDLITIDGYIWRLPRLNRLYLSDAFDERETLLPQLHHLTLTKCSYDQFENIFRYAPCLKSLDVCLTLEPSDIELPIVSSRLIRLRLVIQSCPISLDQIEEFLPNVPNLKHLELILNGYEDLVDGSRWEILTNALITFNFEFTLYGDNYPQVDSFRTLYWLEEKHWYVACREKCLFSVPYFSPVHLDIEDLSHNQSTASVSPIVNSIGIKSVPTNLNIYYNNIKILSINCSISRHEILSTIDLKHVEKLCLKTITDLLIFQPYQSTIPKLYELVIENTIRSGDIEPLLDTDRLQQIRKLNISIGHEQIHLILNRLFDYFPNIESLQYTSYKCSIDTLFYIINGFKSLLNVSFHIYYKQGNIYSDIQSLGQKLYFIKGNNMTYRIEQFNEYLLFDIHFWFAPKPLPPSKAIQWLSKFTYAWYRIQYIAHWIVMRKNLVDASLSLIILYICRYHGYIFTTVNPITEYMFNINPILIGILLCIIAYVLLCRTIDYIATYVFSSIRPLLVVGVILHILCQAIV